MKKKTAKLARIERNRYSIFTDDLKHCYLCGNTPADIHEVFGGANRRASMENGFCVPLCRRHHQRATDDTYFSYVIKQTTQAEYEKTHTRDEFMKIIGRNYL